MQLLFGWIEYALFLIGLNGCVVLYVQKVQPTPYMDEIFHVPQVKQYCQGKYNEWDDMITTLPGLYLLSSLSLQFAAYITGVSVSAICTTYWLRVTNCLFNFGNFLLFSAILYHLHSKGNRDHRRYAVLSSIACSLFPILYFFSFLFYTDAGSTFFVVFAYYLNLKKFHHVSALAGAIAVLFRQTNVIWVAFFAALTSFEILESYVSVNKKTDHPKQSVSYFFYLIREVLRGSISRSPWFVSFIKNLIKSCIAYLLVGIAFLIFLAYNGGIVVGAKEDHRASFHVTQLFYFACFVNFFLSPFIISQSQCEICFKFIFSRLTYVIGMLIVFLLFVHFFTYEHRYLLADNRHYPFYLWSKLYRRHYLVKYMLVPVYIISFFNMYCLFAYKSMVWKVLFLLCCCVSLIPQTLLEFRYFIIPFLLLRLNLPVMCHQKVAIEIFLNIFISFISLYIFTQYPFKWPSEDGQQRFMW